MAAGKWIACGEQAKDTEYFNIFTTSTGVPAKHEPWPLTLGFLFTKLCALSLFPSGCLHSRTFLASKAPFKVKASWPHQVVLFCVKFYS